MSELPGWMMKIFASKFDGNVKHEISNKFELNILIEKCEKIFFKWKTYLLRKACMLSGIILNDNLLIDK